MTRWRGSSETVAPEAVLDEIKGLRSTEMNDDSSETIEAVEQHGSFLLIRTGPCFAVVEQRADRVYPIKPGEREGEPLTPEGLAIAATEAGWLSEEEARRQFRELCDRGDRIARSLR
jgi:hypothetical protein